MNSDLKFLCVGIGIIILIVILFTVLPEKPISYTSIMKSRTVGMFFFLLFTVTFYLLMKRTNEVKQLKFKLLREGLL